MKKLLYVLALAVLPGLAMADEVKDLKDAKADVDAKIAAIKDADCPCKAEAEKLCAGMEHGPAMHACMLEKKDQLSDACKASLEKKLEAAKDAAKDAAMDAAKGEAKAIAPDIKKPDVKKPAKSLKVK